MKRYSQRARGGAVLAELNITPLLDLCFVLLIIFMITTPLMEQSLDVNLPRAKADPAYRLDIGNILSVTVSNKGVIGVGKETLRTAGELEILLRHELQKNPKTVVALRADRDLRYQELMEVLDVVRRSGAPLGLTNLPDAKTTP
ncbi:MAG: biopolymer transporter ExbD [Verrucomicrobiales bacterium]|jgi:biopolymer transport protein ExbD|nr:biopolymer transporter ExbD [Verrucomicrobiales bacterium]